MKLIHCADIHLDSPMETHMTAEQASERNTEVIRSFIRMTNYAVENDVRAVIIAGDLFDGERVRMRTVDEILDAMQRTPEVDYLYVPGNHDKVKHIFFGRSLPDNFKQFGRQWHTYVYENVSVSGIEICDENSNLLYRDIPHTDGHINIISLHGQVGTASGTDKVNLELLKNKGIDYLALGHIHSHVVCPLDEDGVYCYSGCLEGRGFDECGEKGFVFLTTDEKKIRYEFVPFSYRQLHRVYVDITGLSKNSDVWTKMQLAANGIQSNDMVEFILTGYNDPTCNIAASYLQNIIRNHFFFSKVKNESKMRVNPNIYKNDVSLKGEFIRLVLSSNADDAYKAAIIQTGLQALMGEEITL